MWPKFLKLKKDKHLERSKTMARLAELNDELDGVDFEIIAYGTLLRSVNDSLTYAVWAKDLESKFLYANKLCREKMLHCNRDDITGDIDIGMNLAILCATSDKNVYDTQKPVRFIEHNSTWWDTLKLPMYDGNNRLFGIIGEAKDITYLIPDEMRDHVVDPIPIALDLVLCKDVINEILKK